MRVWEWLRDNALWLVGIGLMLSSSGLDGVYMTRWMPDALWWLGFVLNTVADVASMVITYSYGILQRSTQKRESSRVLLVGELVAVLYSWAFSWRQLRLVLPAVEPTDWPWVSAVAAGYIPLLLAFIGYAQSLRDTRFSRESQAPAPEPAPPAATGYHCELCGYVGATQAALNAHQRAHRSNGHKVEVS